MRRVVLSVFMLIGPAVARARVPGSLEVRSSAFSEGGTVPTEYSCDGKGALPPIEWSDVPTATKSIVVMVDDPDAPGRTYAHWLVYNLPPSTRSLSDAGLPPGAEMGLNDAGERAYKPLCPGSAGDHHYRFKVFAIDLPLPSLVQASERDIMTSMGNHVLAQGQLSASYAREGQGSSLTPPESSLPSEAPIAPPMSAPPPPMSMPPTTAPVPDEAPPTAPHTTPMPGAPKVPQPETP